VKKGEKNPSTPKGRGIGVLRRKVFWGLPLGDDKKGKRKREKKVPKENGPVDNMRIMEE
jgi:hypothetical protein